MRRHNEQGKRDSDYKWCLSAAVHRGGPAPMRRRYAQAVWKKIITGGAYPRAVIEERLRLNSPRPTRSAVWPDRTENDGPRSVSGITIA